MKKLLATFIFCALGYLNFAQAPQQFTYQAVVRSTSNALVSNAPVGVRITLLQGSAVGTNVYQETHTPTTNANGLMTVKVGNGTVVSGSFSGIDWSTGTYFIETEIDPNGGTSYSISGTSQLLSVPYALYAENSGSSIPGPQGPAGASGNGIISTLDNGDGTFTFNYADGSFFTTSDLTGPAGSNGVGIDSLTTSGNNFTVYYSNGTNATYSLSSNWTLNGADIYNNNTGNIGIGVTTPLEKVHARDNFLVDGTYGGTDILEVNGAGSRMFFYPRKAAFRAGYATGTEWDDLSVGDHSVALGYFCTASGTNSVSIGRNNTVSGFRAVGLGSSNTVSNAYGISIGATNTSSGNGAYVFGQFTTASGDNSLAIGYFSTASAAVSTTLGGYNTASGGFSTAVGQSTTASGTSAMTFGTGANASSYYEVALGSFNTTYSPASTGSWNTADRLLVVGNGSSNANRSDALVILKSGYVGIGNSTPANKLEVQDANSVTALVSSTGGSAWLAASALSGQEASLILKTYSSGSSSNRWSFGKSTTSESGSDSGSDFYINRYTDAGAYNGQPFSINRANGTVSIGNDNVSASEHTLKVNGSVAYKTQLISTSSNATTLNGDDHVLIYSGAITGNSITLPAASGYTGRSYTIVNHSSSSVSISSYTTANGITSTSIAAGETVELISSGSNWHKIN
jgi:hypothetical protein